MTSKISHRLQVHEKCTKTQGLDFRLTTFFFFALVQCPHRFQVNMPSARFMYEVLAAALLCLLRALIATAEYDTSRNGLGVLDCFGQTCSFGQFCSQSRLYRSCRSCDDITEWCDANKTHMAYVFPTCFYLCERKFQ